MTDRRHLNATDRAVNHAISRRDVLRIGAAVPAAVMLPAWMTTANAQTATTFDFYISTSGDDGNPGTVSSPWAITSLISNSPNNSKIAGKRVGLIQGTYNVAGTAGVAGATKIGHGSYPTNGSFCALSIPPGSSSAPTYVGSSNTSGVYSARAAVIKLVSGQASSGGNQWYNAVIGRDQTSSVGYVTIDGLTINGNGMDCGGADGNEGAHIVFFQSTDGSFTAAGSMAGIVVQNCELYGINATDSGGNDALVWLQGCTGAIVQNNSLHDVNKSSQIDHCHAIEAYSCTGGSWIYNTCYNTTGGGFEAKEGCSGITCAYNYFHNCCTQGGGNAAVLQGWDGAEGNPNSPNLPFMLHHNIFDSCGRVTFGESNNANHTMAVQWYNNTIYDPRGSVGGTVVLQAGSPLIQHYNNLYVMPNAGSVSGFASFSSGNTNPMGFDAVYAPSGSASGAFSGGVNGDPGLTSNPLWTVAVASIVAGGGASQFQLGAGSPCLSAGHVGGTSSGRACNVGAWDGTVTQIGANFTSGSTGTASPVPSAPVLSVS
jgi:hypothetical protein